MKQHNLVLLTYFSFLSMLLPATVSANSELPNIFEKVNPAVVDIQAISMDKVAVSNDQITTIAVGNDGSGVLIDSEGTILTASHVVQSAEQINIKFLDGRVVPASIVTSANWGDIALLKLDEKINLPEPVVLADSDLVRVGEQVFVVGAPFGYSHSLSVGYISSRFFTDAMVGGGSMEVFQTDASMNPGNSGGPLFNMKGEVIGIASHISTTSGGFNGLAFAVTSNQIRALMEKTSPWSGIEGPILTGKLAKLFNIPQDAGLLVQKVAANAWAGQIGILPSTVKAIIDGQEMLIGGDIILKVGTMEVSNSPTFFDDISDYVALESQRENTITITILRNGEILTLSTK